MGSYCPNNTISGVEHICPKGTYGIEKNLTKVSDCTSCPAGKYCMTGYVRGNCSAGYFCKGNQFNATPNFNLSVFATVGLELTFLGTCCTYGRRVCVYVH